MTPDQWAQVITQGGAITVMVVVGWAVLTGRLRLGREVEYRDIRITELKDELKTVAERSEKLITDQAEASRQEAAELRQTIDRLAGRHEPEAAT